MKKELEETTCQIKRLQTENKVRNGFSDDSVCMLKIQQSPLAEISRTQKEIGKSRSKTLLVAELTVLPVVFLLIFVTSTGATLELGTQPTEIMKTKYFTENLRGDTVDTWKSWRLVGNTLNVNIIKSPQITEHQLAVIRNAITSTKVLTDNQGTSALVYYEGWAGALKSASAGQTRYNIPTEFNFVEDGNRAGDIIITLSTIKDTDGYTGYTKSIIEENEILKSFITIYDVSNMPDEQLATIVRHEFGHAIGLGHSTAQEDLMAPSIDMTIPYISKCNVDAVIRLYNGIEGKTGCE
jgi:hypothetical protein